MATQATGMNHSVMRLETSAWIKIGIVAAVASIAAALLVQAGALAMFPSAALFKPLDSFARSALFVLVPAIAATAIFAWLVAHVEKPVSKFIALAVIVLLISFIPDFVLPDANKTLLASSIAALLHLVAGVTMVAVLVWGYQRQQKRA